MKKAAATLAAAPRAATAALPATAEDRRCGTCRHCRGRYVDEGGVGEGGAGAGGEATVKGKCWRYPPTVIFRPYAGSGAAPMSVRPTVGGDDAGCGEWEK